MSTRIAQACIRIEASLSREKKNKKKKKKKRFEHYKAL